ALAGRLGAVVVDHQLHGGAVAAHRSTFLERELKGIAHVLRTIHAADTVGLVPATVDAIRVRIVGRVARHLVDHVPGVDIGKVLHHRVDVVTQPLPHGGAVV